MGGGKESGSRDIFGRVLYGLCVQHVVVLVQEVMKRRRLRFMTIGGMPIQIGGMYETDSVSSVVLFGGDDR